MALIVYKIYPEENYDLAKLEESLRKIDKVKDIKREPIAFGIELLRVGVLVDDKKDNPSKYEDMIKETEGVKDIETEGVSLVS